MEELDLFPYISPGTTQTVIDEMPLFREIAWDFIKNEPIIDKTTNEFVIAEGIEAIKIWIYKTLLTERYAYEIYSDDYGNEVSTLIGQGYTRGYSEAEATRYDKEALLVNPYILEVRKKDAKFNNDTLEVDLLVNTIYGEVDINVRGYDSGVSSSRNAE